MYEYVRKMFVTYGVITQNVVTCIAYGFVDFSPLRITSTGNGATNDWRVVGGQDAENGQFPYQVSLRDSGSHFCGGSILDETTVITAAHCVLRSLPEEVSVVVGTNKLSQGGDVYEVDKLIVHEGYKRRNVGNDVALIKLKGRIPFNDYIQPVQLPTVDVGSGEACVLSGWGKNGLPGIVPDTLQWIQLETIPIKDCMNWNHLVVEDEICTFVGEGKGSCSGDSGGPLVDIEGKLIGIVSWGIPCAAGRPDMFTRVYSYLDWIEKNR